MEIQKLKEENYRLFRELEKKNQIIDTMEQQNESIVSNSNQFKPLNEDLRKKIALL